MGASGFEFSGETSAVRHNHIARATIAYQQALFPLGQMQSHQQTDTGIEAVLIALARHRLLSSLVNPLGGFG